MFGEAGTGLLYSYTGGLDKCAKVQYTGGLMAYIISSRSCRSKWHSLRLSGWIFALDSLYFSRPSRILCCI